MENPQIFKYNLNIKSHSRISKELVGMFFIRMCRMFNHKSCPREEFLFKIFMEYPWNTCKNKAKSLFQWLYFTLKIKKKNWDIPVSKFHV